MTTQTFRPSETYEQALDRAARMWGIEPGYGDTWGGQHVTSPETKKAILGALGVPAATSQELDRAIEDRLWGEWNRLLPPVAVLGERERAFPLHVPLALAGSVADLVIHWENGEVERRGITLSTLQNSGRAELRGAWFVRKEVPVAQGAPLGYHEVEVTLPDGGPRSASMRLILCPDRAYVPPAIRAGRRAAGLAVALYGLRSQRNWGCGDLSDLDAMLDWLAEDVGAGFIGLNPLHAIPNRQPFNTSPYLPSSAFFKNPIYLDLERVEDFRNSARAQALFSRAEIRSEIEALRGAEFVEYERVHALKMRGLKLAFLTFLREFRRESARAAEFREYIEREGELLDRFATWCALDEWIHTRQPDCWVWPDWPDEWRNPDSTATRLFREKHWRSVLFHKYVQWQLDLQLEAVQAQARRKGLSIGLYHDLALATDQCGADLWAHRPFYVAGCRVGAPPDGFSPKGQDWSFPPPNSEHHRETGYRLFAESIRANCRHGGALRIDHVMRFFRLYWIPEGMDATQGAYVRDRCDDLLHILALESVRQKVAIVGEDLGTVTTEIRRALDRFGLFGYRVLYFEKNDRGEFRPPREYTEQALVSATTHDLPTLAGFWLARDVEARHEAGLLHDEAGYRQQLAERAREKQKLLDMLFALGLLPEWSPRKAEQTPELTGELHNALVGWVASAPSALLALNQEDLTKETEQQNLPGTTWEYPNWRRKMRLRVEQLRSEPAARDFTLMLRHWLERTGRLN
ncbi:MAG: 4-alpha-glucanotransferase [Bryobacteraceae bacterium]|jgi:4-alpha-glucanotransferase